MNTSIEIDENWDSSEPLMQEVLNAARIVAASGVTALLTGENGAGKAHLARAIHALSPRRDAPFVTVNCAALPVDTADRLLVGDDDDTGRPGRGSQTGYFRAAEDGSLLLENIDELGPSAQSRLLRFLETGEIVPVDGSTPRHLDVRIIAASQADLDRAVEENRLRKDLFYRLQVVPLAVPPLRERPRDIPTLADRFLDGFARQHRVAPVTLGREAGQALSRQTWPGNVRELRNLCERLTLLLPGRQLGVDNLPAEYRGTQAPPSRLVDLPSTGLVLADLERDLITQALERTGGNRSRAARLLGLTRDTLLYRLKKFALR